MFTFNLSEKASNQIFETFRQGYRAILREATYLPDSAARSFARKLIVTQCNPPNVEKLNRRYWGTGHLRSKLNVENLALRSKKLLRKLRFLERVNLQGTPKDLENVLLRTYGRAGSRRRELLSLLLKPGDDEMLQNSTALRHIIDSQIAINRDATKDIDIEGPPVVPKRQRLEQQKIALFLKSQKEKNPIESLRGRITKWELALPKTNSWGRPLESPRVKNLRRKWLANLLDRILPPLPEHEWNRLADLAQGRQPIEGAPPRRKAAIPSKSIPPICGPEVIKSFLIPARVKLNYWEQATDKAHLDEDDITTKPQRVRTMQRIYRMVWSLSPKMVQDEDTKKYTITWGGERSPSAAGEITQPRLKDNEFFQMPKSGLVEGTISRKVRKQIERYAKKLSP